MKKVLAKLQIAKLLHKSKKCECHQKEIHFLGFIIKKHEIRMNLAKIKAILMWPELTIITQVQSFLGFANFYKRFIYNYFAIAKAFINLIKKN